MSEERIVGGAVSIGRRLLSHAAVLAGAGLLTVTFFLVLPVIQRLGRTDRADTVVRAMDTTVLPPPPPTIEEEKPPEPEPEDPPPELQDDTQLLSLEQLEMALSPNFGDSLFSGGPQIDIGSMFASQMGGMEAFQASDLDKPARAIYQASPAMTAKMRKNAPGSVQVIFVVDERGRVSQAAVRKSTHPIFDKAALAAVKQWRFEPAESGGRPVSFRTSCEVVFEKN